MLEYYDRESIERATVSEIDSKHSARPFAFSVRVPSPDGYHFALGEFAAESPEMRDRWIRGFRKFSPGYQSGLIPSSSDRPKCLRLSLVALCLGVTMGLACESMLWLWWY